MKQFSLLFLLAFLFSVANAQPRSAADDAFIRQFRNIVNASMAEQVIDNYIGEEEDGNYTKSEYSCRLPLKDFELWVTEINGWHNINGEYSGSTGENVMYPKLLAAFQSIGGSYKVEQNNSKYTNHLGQVARSIYLKKSDGGTVATAHFMTDKKIFLDFTLNLETEESRWKHKVDKEISTEAECIAAINKLLAKVVGKTFTSKDASVKITRMEITSTGVFTNLNASSVESGKKTNRVQTVTYSKINWKESTFENAGNSSIDGLVVLVISFKNSVERTSNETGKPVTDSADELEELVVLEEDREAVMAYFQWLSEQKK